MKQLLLYIVSKGKSTNFFLYELKHVAPSKTLKKLHLLTLRGPKFSGQGRESEEVKSKAHVSTFF